MSNLKNITLLEINIIPIPEKRVEINQSIVLLLGNMQQYCSNYKIVDNENSISLVAELDGPAHLDSFLSSKECTILWGAINTLGIKSEISINGVQRNGLDLNLINSDSIKNGSGPGYDTN